MQNQKKEHPKEKERLHPRNKHRERYNFELLIKNCPELKHFVSSNIYGDESIDFFNAEAVKMLNKALLMTHYKLTYWDIPSGYLCPPIPGRADYIHHVADLLAASNFGKIPIGNKIVALDIGVGANCVYPIIGNHEYGWSFIGSDIDTVALESASTIIASNGAIQNDVHCRLQDNASDTFYGIIKKGEYIDITICNPPFNSSEAEASANNQRKLSNLKERKIKSPKLNFSGKNNELWCEGGEKRFIDNMINQSIKYAKSCCWFTTLVSKQSHLKHIYDALDKAETTEYKTLPMGQGNKTSRIVAWTFLQTDEEKKWVEERWS